MLNLTISHPVYAVLVQGAMVRREDGVIRMFARKRRTEAQPKRTDSPAPIAISAWTPPPGEPPAA